MDIYAENILDHFHRPRHKGVVKNATARAEDSNPVCGDEIKIELIVDKKGIIKDAAFSGEGCAISQASASMLLEKIIGKKADSVKKMQMKDICKMLGVTLTPVRLKCALLSLHVLKKALNRIEK
jgi:nitrogen fixation protein NifU and related proteins